MVACLLTIKEPMRTALKTQQKAHIATNVGLSVTTIKKHLHSIKTHRKKPKHIATICTKKSENHADR